MPKNANGDVVCINHPNEVLTNKMFVNLPQLHYDANQGKLQQVNQYSPMKFSFCQQCGYIEFYTIRPDEDFPQHTHEIEKE